MSKEVRNTVTDSDINKIEIIRDSIIFNPTPNMRKAKAKFYSRTDGVIGTPNNSSAAMVSKLIDEPAVIKWWGTPGFREWFFNSEESKERLEYLFMLALDTAENVLLDPDANASAKVQMIKVLSSLAGKDRKDNEKLLDERIQKMDAAQLREYIKIQAPKLLEAEDSDIPEIEE